MTQLFRGGLLIDGTGRAPMPHSAILVEGDRIAAVGRAEISTRGRDRRVIRGWDATRQLRRRLEPQSLSIARRDEIATNR
jgi:hypothetical protein